MSKKGRVALQTQANEIRTETGEKLNTAQRVGQMDVDQNDSFLNIDDDAALYDQSTEVAALEAAIPILNSDDSWEMQPSADGHVSPVNQSMYIDGINVGSEAATELNPRVFQAGKTNVSNPNLVEFSAVNADDVNENGVIGINTTDADASGGKTKIVLWGKAKRINTSGWLFGQILFVSSTGKTLTDSPDVYNAIPVARVDVVHATEGELFVFSLRTQKLATNALTLGFSRTYFTGDTETTPQGTFYQLQDDKGVVTTDSDFVDVDDNVTETFSAEFLGGNFVVPTLIQAGNYRMLLSYQVDTADDFEKFTAEYYVTDDEGLVQDSGNGTPVGTKGVSPIFVMTSAQLDSLAGVELSATLNGDITDDYNLSENQRLLVVFTGAKVGTAGGVKRITIYFGSDHNTFFDAPTNIYLGNLADVNDNGTTGDIMRKGSDGIWRNHSGNVDTASQLPSLADVAQYQGLAQGDVLTWGASGFWQNIVNPSFLKTDHVAAFTGTAAEPVITNAEGKIAGDLLDTTPLEFVGDFTPQAGTEYPPTPSVGQTWIVVGVGDGYTFTGGDLNAETAYQSSWMQWTGAEWLLMNNTPSSAITADIGLVETNNYPSNSIRNYEAMTQAEYDGLGAIDANTLYLIV